MGAGKEKRVSQHGGKILRRAKPAHVCGVKLPQPRPVEDAPEYAKIPFITHGYRVGYNFQQCVASLATLHNETFNIWTHLVSFCIFLYLFWVVFTQDDLTSLTVPETMGIAIFLLTAMACMLFSTMYHTFLSHSEEVFDCTLGLDQTGISLLIGGSYFPGVTLGFHCQPIFQVLYGIMAISIIITGIYLTRAKFKHHSTKANCFAVLVAVGVVPALHWTMNTPACVRTKLLPSLLSMFFFYGLGFVFYSSRFPESVWPGKFNIFFHSHQIWHVCIFAAVYSWFQNVALSKELVISSEDICVNACTQ